MTGIIRHRPIHHVRPPPLAIEKTCASCKYLCAGNTCFKYPKLKTDKEGHVPYALIPHPALTARCKRGRRAE